MNSFRLILWILLIFLFIIGLTLYFYYSDNKDYSENKRRQYKIIRYVGITLCFISVIMTILLLVFNFSCQSSQSAEMPPGSCNMCLLYKRRYDTLNPYKPEELNLLKNHAEACNECSLMCLDKLKLAEKYSPQDVSKIVKECDKYTGISLKADREYNKLSTKVAQTKLNKAVNAWQIANKLSGNKQVYLDPFPQVPKKLI
jgi:heme/copper-type cytochrome/quinol oxidase subunit 2